MPKGFLGSRVGRLAGLFVVSLWGAASLAAADCTCYDGADFWGRPVDPGVTHCGFRVCGGDSQLYECREGGWTAVGGEACGASLCHCPNGTNFWQQPVDAESTHCGYRVCGLDDLFYDCTTQGWSGVPGSEGCSSGGTGCSCDGGVDFWDQPIPRADTYCGMQVCGRDDQLYECRAGGWAAIGGFPCAARPRYNEVRQKSSHNSYERHEILTDQLVFHRIRSIELDIFNDPLTLGDWLVTHGTFSRASWCTRLSDCLDELKAFHDANPEHEVVTVWIDLKSHWDPDFSHGPQDLDSRITSHLPAASLFKPQDLLNACGSPATLQQAVLGSCAWPELSNLRGRFLFVLTCGDSGCGNVGALDTYIGQGPAATSRVAFIAPKLPDTSWETRNDAVFFNMSESNAHLASSVEQAGFVSRVYGLNDLTAWNDAVAHRAHHLGTDNVNIFQDPQMVTHAANGWPFQCLYGCNHGPERVRVLGMEVNSEDIWNSSDHLRFLAVDDDSGAAVSWEASVTTPNSHVEEFAKGCLMARQSTAGNSAYFAVCRPADDNPLRIQWRGTAGGSTSALEYFGLPYPRIEEESWTFIRLRIDSDGRCAHGDGSLDGMNWSLIGSRCFSGDRLRYQGVAVSSHGEPAVRFLFTNLSRANQPMTAGSFPLALSIGTVRSAVAFDGVMP